MRKGAQSAPPPGPLPKQGGQMALTGRTEEGRRLLGTVMLSRASWASSPLEAEVGVLVMLMLRCSLRVSRL